MSAAGRTVHLHAGQVFCDRLPHLVTTLLGSCVSVCLWDVRLRHGGMTHALLPHGRPGADWTPRYADASVDLLREALLGLGSRPGNLIAKVFGGADVLPAAPAGESVGLRNVQAALERLAFHGIPLKARRTGGSSGVVLELDSASGEVWLRPVPQQERKVTQDDRRPLPRGQCCCS